MLNGIEGVFPVKEIATQIVKAVQPVELRCRVEHEAWTSLKPGRVRGLDEFNAGVESYSGEGWSKLERI